MTVWKISWTIVSNLLNVITGNLLIGDESVFPATTYPLTVNSAAAMQAQIQAFCDARGYSAAAAAPVIVAANTAGGFPA
jgi:hypothetical protein